MSDYIIVDLQELGRDSVSIAGGKGALLGELLSRGYPVPRGFCITTGAYDDFLRISGIDAQIAELRKIKDDAQRLEASEAVMTAIQQAAIPADLAVGLSTIYRTLGQRPRVAVRPSPAYQTLLRSPIAGKTEHFLNIVGEKDLFQAVRDIWANIWEGFVLSFCQRRAIKHAELRPAVIVQAMVRPISSGTIFTADPVAGDRDKLLITAGWGMKQESISGQVSPDTYHVDRETLTLRFKRIVTKELMVSASGLVPVPKNRRNAVVLKDAAIRDLCQMATGIEDIFGEPAEVEWCVLQGGGFTVLEALPVSVDDELLGDEADGEAAAVAVKSKTAPVAAEEPTPVEETAAVVEPSPAEDQPPAEAAAASDEAVPESVPTAGPTAEPATEPAAEPATEPATEPAAEPATEPATESDEGTPGDESDETATTDETETDDSLLSRTPPES